MRGKACTCGTVHGKNRITPAYAGKRYLSRIGDALMGDHPRLCGEKHRRHGCYMITKGSPPPMRGKGDKFLTIFTTVRITPAYAGKRFLSLDRLQANLDHPRLCGEKPVKCSLKNPVTGSPPPMRGKVLESLDSGIPVGITPAYAGKRYA